MTTNNLPQHPITAPEPCTPKADETALDWLLYHSNGTGERPRTMRDRADSFFCCSSTTTNAKTASGTGISFVDEVFRSQHTSKQKSGAGMFLEISGSGQTGKTYLMLQLAASYLLKTDMDYENSELGLIQGQFSHFGLVNSSAPPNVVIFDLEYGIIMEQLFMIVRTTVLRSLDAVENQIENAEKVECLTARLLGRIHLLRPRDNSDLVSALESLRFSLGGLDKTTDGNHNAPLLILIDSIGSFDQRNRYLELLGNLSCSSKRSIGASNSYGLSGTDDFKRQLQRLRNHSQNIAIISTRHTSRQPNSVPNSPVTHRIFLERTKHDTPEEKNGFSFVALYCTGTMNSKVDFCTPFSVSTAGIFTAT